jgi:hypothetical protein
MVGNAGVIKAEVVLISKKSDEDKHRWVYLDIGKFGGLAETMDEAIRYPIRTVHDGDEPAPAFSPARPAIRRTCCTRRRRTAADLAFDRRRAADRRHRCLHVDLLGGGLQRLRAAEGVRDMMPVASAAGAWASPLAMDPTGSARGDASAAAFILPGPRR